MSALIIDWLGRGGIAQTTEAWAIELGAHDVPVDVVTRGGRELGAGIITVHSSADARGRFGAHRAVAAAAVRRIRDVRPDTVVIQNYVVPALEAPVYAAARAVGARVVVVIHDHRLHTWRAGTRMGLGRRLREADVVVTHTSFVADGVRNFARCGDVMVIPHPAQVGMLAHPTELPRLIARPDRWCGHFGVLRRRYKGTGVVEGLATAGLTGWGFLALGVGAPLGVRGLESIPGYAPPGSLIGAVQMTDATLAPYDRATQSGVVVLAHLLGSVPVASAVGGIPEQIDDGIDGLLVPAGAPLSAWQDALAALDDDTYRKELAVNGIDRAWRDHERFVGAITELVA